MQRVGIEVAKRGKYGHWRDSFGYWSPMFIEITQALDHTEVTTRDWVVSNYAFIPSIEELDTAIVAV
jgi:hypothetical protein